MLTRECIDTDVTFHASMNAFKHWRCSAQTLETSWMRIFLTNVNVFEASINGVMQYRLHASIRDGCHIQMRFHVLEFICKQSKFVAQKSDISYRRGCMQTLVVLSTIEILDANVRVF